MERRGRERGRNGGKKGEIEGGEEAGREKIIKNIMPGFRVWLSGKALG